MPTPIVPVKTSRIVAWMAILAASGLTILNSQAVWARAAMAVPKKGGYCLVSDYRTVKQVEKVSVTMPNQDTTMGKLRGTKYFEKFHMLQGYWQCPPAKEVQEIFTTTTPTGKYTPRRGPQGVLDATSKSRSIRCLSLYQTRR